MDERDYDSTTSQSVVLYNVKETNDDVKVVTDLMNKLKVPSSYIKHSTRLEKKALFQNLNLAPVLLNDKRLLMANAHLLKGTTYFVKPKLVWADRQRKKSLLKLRYDLIQEGFDEKFLRIRDLKLFKGDQIDDTCSFANIRSHLESIKLTDDNSN